MDASRRTLSDLDSVAADLGTLLRRVAALEEHLAAGQAHQVKLAGQIERMAGDTDRRRVEALEGQIEAVLANHTRTDERLTRLTEELERIRRTEDGLQRLRTELGLAIDRQGAAVTAELAQAGEQRSGETARVARELQAVLLRLETLEQLHTRLAATERQQGEISREQGQLAARVAAVADERGALQDLVNRAQQQQSAGLDQVVKELAGLQAEMATWRSALNANAEVVREARTQVDLARTEAAQMHQAHHATAEAQRLSEARVEAQLAELRREVADTWATFQKARELEHQERAKADAARDSDVRASIEQVARQAAEDRALLADRVEAEHQAAVVELADIRRMLALLAQAGQQAWAGLAAQTAADLPPEEPADEAGERRQALRDSLRARSPLTRR